MVKYLAKTESGVPTAFVSFDGFDLFANAFFFVNRQKLSRVQLTRPSQPLRVLRLRSPREPKPRRRPGERLRLRISSITMCTWIKRDLTRSPVKFQRFSALPVLSFVRSSRLMDHSQEQSLKSLPREERSSVLETLIPSSIYSWVPEPRLPPRRLRRKLLLPPLVRRRRARSDVRPLAKWTY